MQLSIILEIILYNAAVLHSYVEHAAAKLQIEQAPKSSEMLSNNKPSQDDYYHQLNVYDKGNDDLNIADDDDDNDDIIGNSQINGQEKDEFSNDDVLDFWPLKQSPLFLGQVKVTNKVENLVVAESKFKGNLASITSSSTSTSVTATSPTTTARIPTNLKTRNTLMSSSPVPILQRYIFGQRHYNEQLNRLLGNKKTRTTTPTTVTTAAADHDDGNGDDQLLRLQDYNFLYNAERHTYFQLHTNLTAANMTSTILMMMTTMMKKTKSNRRIGGLQDNITAGQRLLYSVVGNTLNAAFGFNAGGIKPSKNTNADMKVEMVQLYDAASLRRTRYNPFKATRILVHGWLGNANANVYGALVPAYLEQLHTGDYNIFTVDWGRGAIADYITASYRVKPVGKMLAKFIDFLHKEAGMRFEDLQVIGFSMGAHIAGIAGKHVQTGRLRIIRALDPALPFFRYSSESERLSRNDAEYVEVLHTSVGSYGFDRPLGHADFYANWGSAQPGCFWNECSHWRAFQLFAESLKQQKWSGMRTHGFLAQGCLPEHWQQLTRNKLCKRSVTGQQQTMMMGGDLGDITEAGDLAKRHGVYYFQTNANSPYAIG